MEPDGLVPSGTFIDFMWYSFDSDKPFDEPVSSEDGAQITGIVGDSLEGEIPPVQSPPGSSTMLL